jgi:hypothetical protein
MRDSGAFSIDLNDKHNIVGASADFEALPLKPWMDLATLALLAESGELHWNGRDDASLSEASQVRLAGLSGVRPNHYWEDLLHYGKTLKLFKAEGPLWKICSKDSEILGATRRECFPAMLAAWMKSPVPIPELVELDIEQCKEVNFRMELIRFITELGTNQWYPYDRLGTAVKEAAGKQGLDLGSENVSRLTRVLTERVFLVLGAISINIEGDHFIPRSEIYTPPGRHEPRAESFRKVVATGFERDQSWRRVATGLWRCIETRRSRQAGQSSVRCLDDRHLETDPRLPFKDCLFLASLGRLVSNKEVTLNDPGRYVFELEPTTLRRKVEEGMDLEEIANFLRARCPTDSFSKLKIFLNSST